MKKLLLFITLIITASSFAEKKTICLINNSDYPNASERMLLATSYKEHEPSISDVKQKIVHPGSIEAIIVDEGNTIQLIAPIDKNPKNYNNSTLAPHQFATIHPGWKAEPQGSIAFKEIKDGNVCESVKADIVIYFETMSNWKIYGNIPA